MTVTNCTLTGNQAMGGNNGNGTALFGEGLGGGMMNVFGTLTLSNCTLTGNQALGGTGSTAPVENPPTDSGQGGGIVNLEGTLIATNCTLSGNQAIGGAGGTGGNGGNGFGGGLFNDGVSIWPTNAGTPATLTVLGSTISDNQATGGAAGAGGSVGQGVGGGAYFADGGVVCLDAFTQAHVKKNHASTSYNDIFGDFTTC